MQALHTIKIVNQNNYLLETLETIMLNYPKSYNHEIKSYTKMYSYGEQFIISINDKYNNNIIDYRITFYKNNNSDFKISCDIESLN